MPRSTLGYWNVRGLAQPIRFLLHYVDEDFTDQLYVIGPAPEYSREDWKKVENNLGLDFPNLPYYIDDDVRITQSNTIIRYLGHKYNLLGSTLKEKITCDMMVETAMDFRNMSVYVSYNPDYENLKGDYFSNYLPTTLTGFEKYLGDKPWFAGENITVCDFPFYELLDQNREVAPTCLDKFPKLRAFLSRFESLPRNKLFMTTPMYMKHPIHNPYANFL
ncbi:glutathione S-transferase Mu 4 [Patella vulgata]|uniref:glutathione S-transferase Mu 4 n=1 Tax=Patella vulgata TaxID=6465 RepID=UPI00217F921D|nr:glutathione S-transferase Mu 4 [Patella vulgata]